MRSFRRSLVATLALATAAAPLVAALPASATPSGPSVAVVVRGASAGEAAGAVQRLGGRVTLQLDLVNGVAASVPSSAVDALQAAGLSVVPDAPAKVVGTDYVTTGGGVQIDAMDPGPAWDRTAGNNIGVALVDTGVADSPDLAGRLVRGPDLSGEGDGLDHYGHGTFMAGLIAANGSHPGVAPAARIISVKVAGRDGTTTLSKVIAGIGWVVVHQDEVGASVLNLSLGVEAPMPYREDPLAAAVEAAWSSGLTVVVAAGNSGSGDVTSPGHDPYVITVGATDPHGTATVADDTVPTWSGSDHLKGYDKPELLAPGVSVVSLRSPGSTIDTTYPAARTADGYFRGSGTSMATALTSGAVAALLDRHPLATPDDVKGALEDGAQSLGKKVIGGAVDLAAADAQQGQQRWEQHYPIAFDGLGVGLRQMPWVGTRWSGTRWSGTRWSGSTWSGSTWSGTRWSGSTWSGSTWSGSTWSGSTWSGTRWSDAAWSGTRWSGSTWSGSTWSGDAWDGTRWSGSTWSAAGWGDNAPVG
jgi:serine protease AprX